MKRKDLKILFVDDDQFALENLNELLIKAFKEVKICQSAQEALEIIKTYEPDVLISDIRMNGMDGIELTGIVQKQIPNIHTIIVSAFSDVAYFLDAIKLGVDRYFIKPIDVRQLFKHLDKIHNALETKHKYIQTVHLLEDYKKIVDLATIVTKTDKNGVLTYVNDKFCELSEYSRDELIGTAHNIVRDPTVPKEFYKHLWETISKQKIWQGIMPNISKTGKRFFIRTTIMPILNENNEIEEYISLKEDITQIIEQKEILRQQIITDSLTTLSNRNKLANDINKHILRSFILFDIDRFKQINNYFGHYYGDEVLKYFAQKLIQNLSNGYDCYRFSADEFIVSFETELTNTEVYVWVKNLQLDILKNPFTHKNVSVGIDFATGFYTTSTITSPDNIYQNLSTAVKIAQDQKKQIVFFDDSMSQKEKYEQNFYWTNKIKEALKEDRIGVVYQPILNIQTNKVDKFECLVRIFESDGTLIAPAEFLELSKQSILYTVITRRVITKALEQIANFDCKFNINLSIEDILNEDISNLLISYIKDSDIGHKLSIEILESEGIENYDKVQKFIKLMKQYGIEIAIDDFGSGYSNFSYMANLKIDVLKIDGSIIKKILTDKNSLIIARTLTQFAKEMEIKSVAEFVSSEEIFKKVKELGFDYAQGYFISPPILAEQIKDFL